MAQCSAVNPGLSLFGSAPFSSRYRAIVAVTREGRQRGGADAPRIVVVHVGAGLDEQPRRRAHRRRGPRTSAPYRRRAESSGCIREDRAAAPPSSAPSSRCARARRRRAARSSLTTSACFCATAHISAVWPRGPRALGFAPFASSASTTAGLPARDAAISGVSPDSSAAFGFAPASSSRVDDRARCRSGSRPTAAWRRCRSRRSHSRRRG